MVKGAHLCGRTFVSHGVPVVVPITCSTVTEDAMLKVYPTSGPALTFHNPDGSSKFFCRAAIGLVDEHRHVLKPSTRTPTCDWFVPVITAQ